MESEVRLEDACDRIVDCPHKTAPATEEKPHAYAVGTKAIGLDGSIDWQKCRPVSAETYNTWTTRLRPEPGDLIFCREAPVGPLATVPASPRVCLGQRTVLLRPDPRQVIPAWLAYALRSPAMQRRLRMLAEGSTVAHLNVSDIRAFKISVPPIDEQRRIASLLGALDEKIQSNRRLAETAEALGREVFRQHLHALDATRAPSSWPRLPFSGAVRLNPAVKLSKRTEAPFVEMRACAPFSTRPTSVGTRPVAGGAKFEPGDILFARITPCTENGKGAFVDFISTAGFGSTEFIVMRPGDLLSSPAVWFLSRESRVRTHAIKAMTGSTGRQRVPVAAFDDLRVAIPPSTSDWAKAADAMQAMMSIGLGAWRENFVLSGLRDALLPKLVSGQIRVPPTDDSEEALGEIVEAHESEEPQAE